MCSVLGYIGKREAQQLILDGLARLEYRGYDSAGFACISGPDSALSYVKSAGQLSSLIEQCKSHQIDGSLAIGHTRWATHGGFSTENAHPHFDCHKRIALMHNGIIENYHTLRQQLLFVGHSFHSDTDTEVVSHLLEEAIGSGSLITAAALISVAAQLEGAYAIVACMHGHSDALMFMRKGSPLCIGVGEGEYFVASDPFAFSASTKKVIFIPDQSVGIISRSGVALYDYDGNVREIVATQIEIAHDMQTKGEYEHFMLKEIAEQPDAINRTINYLREIDQCDTLFQALGCDEEFLNEIDSIHFIACGTSAHASSIAAHFFEEIAGIPSFISLASELRYKRFFPNKRTLYVAVSQSGETADTLEAVRMMQTHDVKVVCISNVASSTLVREVAGHLLTKAGPEIAVASTKAFSTQLTVLYWLAHAIAYTRGDVAREKFDSAYQEVASAALSMRAALDRYEHDIVNHRASQYTSSKSMIFLGRHITYPFAQEAALKLQEISYIVAQSYPAGELKHGPLALIDTAMVVVIFSCQDPILYQKIVSSAQEVKARGAHLIIFAFSGQDSLITLADTLFIFPHVAPLLEPLAMTQVMQTFVAHIALFLGRPLDKPRNLAKSVTVE